MTLPDFLYHKIETGKHFIIHLPMEERIKNIMDEYEPEKHKDEFIKAFQHVKKRIHTPIAKQIEIDLERSAFESAVKLLLEYYYDPRYKHANEHHMKSKPIIIDARDIDDAYGQLLKML